MRFENAFEVKGSPSQVIGLFEDPRQMASFLPGASVGDPNPDGSPPKPHEERQNQHRKSCERFNNIGITSFNKCFRFLL